LLNYRLNQYGGSDDCFMNYFPTDADDR
jgi:hypothetical protein